MKRTTFITPANYTSEQISNLIGKDSKVKEITVKKVYDKECIQSISTEDILSLGYSKPLFYKEESFTWLEEHYLELFDENFYEAGEVMFVETESTL